MSFKIGWFSTGRDGEARELLEGIYQKIDEGIIKARIPFVFCNRDAEEEKESDKFLSLVNSFGIDLLSFSSKNFKPDKWKWEREAWRREYDEEVIKRIQGYNPDVIMLAGYMLIVSKEMCQTYKLVNLHPALPEGPVGTFEEVIWRLIEGRKEKGGVMIHLVTEELDKGPPITYCSFTLCGKSFDPLWRELEYKGLERVKKEEGKSNKLFLQIRRQQTLREIPLVIYTLKALSEGSIRIEEGKVWVGESLGPYCLNGVIDASIQF